MTRFTRLSIASALMIGAWIFGCSSAEPEESSATADAPLLSLCVPGQTQTCQVDPRLHTVICTTCVSTVPVCPDPHTIRKNNLCAPCGFEGVPECPWGCDAPLTVNAGVCRPCDGTLTPKCLDFIATGPDGGGPSSGGQSFRRCAEYGVPAGDVLIDREWDPTTCGNPTWPTANVFRVAPMP